MQRGTRSSTPMAWVPGWPSWTRILRAAGCRSTSGSSLMVMNSEGIESTRSGCREGTPQATPTASPGNGLRALIDKRRTAASTNSAPEARCVVPAAILPGHSCPVGSVIIAVTLCEVSLKPVVCVGLVVEGLHFDEPGCLVQPPSLGQRAIRLQSQRAHATGLRFLDKLVKNAPAKAKPPEVRGRPHAFDFRDPSVRAQLERTTPDRIAMQHGHQEQPVRQPHLIVSRRNALTWVEPAVEPTSEFFEVGPQAVPGCWGAGVRDLDLHL